MKFPRSSSRKKLELFVVCCLGYSTLAKEVENDDSSTVKTFCWSLNESCRLSSLFVEPRLIGSISRIYDGLKTRSELDKKRLRGAAWTHLHQTYHDPSWCPSTPQEWEDDPLGGMSHKVDPSKKFYDRTISEIVTQWKWIRKGSTTVWTNYDRSGRQGMMKP